MDSVAKYDDDTIRYGYQIIIKRKFEANGSKLVKIGKDKYFFFGKQKLESNQFIGQKFGSTFELNRETGEMKFMEVPSIDVKTGEIEAEKDNRNIYDDNTSQRLTKDDIEEMKKQTTGTELIKCLVDNSLSFEGKSKFSQEKYLTKKKLKYLNLFTVIKPSTKFLIEMYFAQNPSKNSYLRIDTLSQMLNVCNVMSGGKYMIVDSNLGILAAALMERTAGVGSVIQVHTENVLSGSARQSVNALNFPESILAQCLHSISMNEAIDVLQDEAEEMETEVEAKEDCRMFSELNTEEKRVWRREKRLAKIKQVQSILRQRDMDALLVITKTFEPHSLVAPLFEFLAPSRTFAIFCQSIEPLKECYIQLKKRAIFLRISETWLRRYQVLPERTHPENVMNASSGYILTGIKVEN